MSKAYSKKCLRILKARGYFNSRGRFSNLSLNAKRRNRKKLAALRRRRGGLARGKFKMRLNFEFPEDRVQELKDLQAAAGAENMKELVNNALTILEWAIKEVKNGNETAAVNENDQVYRVLITPLLERAAKKYPKPEVAMKG